MNRGLQQLKSDLLEIGRLGHRLGRELEQLTCAGVSEKELQALRTRPLLTLPVRLVGEIPHE